MKFLRDQVARLTTSASAAISLVVVAGSLFTQTLVSAGLLLALAAPQLHSPPPSLPPAGEAEPTREAEAQAEEEAIEKRWRAIRFYATTIYEPGDFPKPGYYAADGTPWTPESGGRCYDGLKKPLSPQSEWEPGIDVSPIEMLGLGSAFGVD